jgi:chromosome segregation ATPase
MDQELIAYLEARFREINQQITGSREETTQQIASLREEMGDLRGEFGGLRGEFGGLREELGKLRGEFESFRTETGRNFDRVDADIRENGTMVEYVRDQVKIVSEGVKGTNERLDAFKAEVAQEFRDVRSLIHLSYKDLDRRIRRSDEDGEGLKIGTPG